jgi:hypothetical protein
MDYYLRNKDAINERRREKYKLTRQKLNNPIILNCNNDLPVEAEEYQTDPKQREFLESALKFESIMQQCTFSHCSICRQRRLGLQTADGICMRCKSSKHKILFGHENKALPTWTKDNEVMFDLPKELSNLTMAEKLLIQRVSPLVPVIHIKNGILGVRGHIVSFFQDISCITTILPRLPSEVSIVKVIRDGQTRCGNEIKKTFTVDRVKILKALLWLKKYNCLYKDIIIDESRLSWMGNCKTRELKSIVSISSESSQAELDKDRYVSVFIFFAKEEPHGY